MDTTGDCKQAAETAIEQHTLLSQYRYCQRPNKTNAWYKSCKRIDQQILLETKMRKTATVQHRLLETARDHQ